MYKDSLDDAVLEVRIVTCSNRKEGYACDVIKVCNLWSPIGIPD